MINFYFLLFSPSGFLQPAVIALIIRTKLTAPLMDASGTLTPKSVNRIALNPTFKSTYRDFPGGPVAEALCSQCRNLEVIPWSGDKILHATTNTEDPHAKTWCAQISKQINIKKKKYLYWFSQYCPPNVFVFLNTAMVCFCLVFYCFVLFSVKR